MPPLHREHCTLNNGSYYIAKANGVEHEKIWTDCCASRSKPAACATNLFFVTRNNLGEGRKKK
jgi:hypothetical protein